MDSRVAKRYAKALLLLGVEDGNYRKYGEELQEFVQFCMDSQEFFAVVANPVFSPEDRKDVLDFVLEKTSFSDIVKNFLRLLLEKRRMAFVPEIATYYSRLTDEMSGVAKVQVISARSLNKGSLDKLRVALKKIVSNKDIEFDLSVDKSIIGGVIVKIGDLVIDGSVTAQLRGLKESLKRGEYN